MLGDPASRIVTELGALGGVKIDSEDDVSNRVQAWIPALEVDDAARLAGVTEVTLPDYLHVNNVVSAGDTLLKADKVRALFPGIDGTGVKIGVMSDGATNAADVASELGNYTISQVGSGNEGTAMMEIVHDLAPGAQLFFYGPSTSVDMANGINYLANTAHCNVIVDDLSFFGEGYFQDTSVATAAQNAVSNGVVYTTSAGNYSNQQHWQGNYTSSLSTGYLPASHLMSFSAGDPNNILTVPAGGTLQVFMEWSDPMAGSSNDYNLYLIDANDLSSILKKSQSVQTGTQNPFESFAYTNNTGSTKSVILNVEKKDSAAGRTVEIFTYGNSSMKYSSAGDALIGQEAVTGVMSVAAENAGAIGVAAYSSHGGSTSFTNFATHTSTVRQTLDGTAIDGVHTALGAGAWGHDPFYGTSAAAPHAAAIAGLIKQINPSLTPAQIVQIMADTATDFTAYGVGYDTTSGAGLYNALDAAYKAYTPAAVDLAAASDSGVSNSDNITNDTTPTFTGTVPAGSYVTLYVDGVANQTVQLGAGVSTYNLTTTALSNATHAITIKVVSSSAVISSNFSNASTALNVTIDSVAPAAPTAPDLVAASDSGVSNTDNITNVTQPNFTGSAEAGSTVTLFSNGAAVGSAASNSTFTAAPSVAMTDGSYSITAQAMDTAGNLSALSAALTPVKIDTTAPVILVPIYDANLASMTVKVGFTEDVSGSLNSSSLKLQDIHTSQLLPAVDQAYSYNAASNIASFTFVPGFPGKGILPDGDYQAAMYGTFVSDLAGNHPATDQSTNFFFFQADANFDRTINAADFNAIATNFGGEQDLQPGRFQLRRYGRHGRLRDPRCEVRADPSTTRAGPWKPDQRSRGADGWIFV